MADSPKNLYGFEDEISNKKDELVGGITSAFNQWIRSIDVNKATKLIELPKSFNFINFNYTTTLQDVYDIPEDNILHIHGKVRERIVFGHGRGISSTTQSVRDMSEPWFEQSHRDVSSVPGVFHKPVEDILQRNKEIIEGYGDLTNIIVIGHSVNDIDIPYFKCILNAYPDAKWSNYNHEDFDKGIFNVDETHDKLINTGVPEEKLTSKSSEELKTIYSAAQPHAELTFE